MASLNITVLNDAGFCHYREKLAHLYYKAFTTGPYAQYLSNSEVTDRMTMLNIYGDGLIAEWDTRLAGFLFWHDLQHDSKFPHVKMDQNATYGYIAEVVVDVAYRGKGIATRMIEFAIDEMRSEYDWVVIRVWSENEPALRLYRKLNFNEVASIEQIKRDIEHKPLEMGSLYLIRKT